MSFLKDIPLKLKNFLVNSALLPFWYVAIYMYLPSVYNTNDLWLIISFCICLTLLSYIISLNFFIYVERINRSQEYISIKRVFYKLTIELNEIVILQNKTDDELDEVNLEIKFFKKKEDVELREDEVKRFKVLESRVKSLSSSSNELKEKLISIPKRQKLLKKRMKMLRKKIKKIDLEPLSIDIALPNAQFQVSVISILIFSEYIWDLIFGFGLMFYGFIIIYFSILLSFSFILKIYYEIINRIVRNKKKYLIINPNNF
jgi:hypothetical protein